jgi:hypothetical protein
MANLEETAADVLALIPQYSWEIMDESQRDDLMTKVVLPRYMKRTHDGVQLTPKWWGQAVGASPAAIKNRVLRLRQSQKQANGSVAVRPEAELHTERAARRVLRNPEQLRRVIDTLDDEERGKVQRVTSQWKGWSKSNPKPGTDINEIADKKVWEAKSALVRLAELLKEDTLDDETEAHVIEMCGQIGAIAQHIVNMISGTAEFNAEVEEWLRDE